jgi:hypothetical protein
VAVGGTSLTTYSSWGTYRSESAWSGSGGGVSGYVGEPRYQWSAQQTGRRTTPDVSYDADPNTGYYVYTTTAYGGYTGWLEVGGTSAAAPQWAGLIALADQGRALVGKGSLDGPTQTLPGLYAMAGSNFHDITSGSNGYSAHAGYDLATGRGSPYADRIVHALVALSSGPVSSAVAASLTAGPVSSPHGSFNVVPVPTPVDPGPDGAFGSLVVVNSLSGVSRVQQYPAPLPESSIARLPGPARLFTEGSGQGGGFGLAPFPLPTVVGEDPVPVPERQEQEQTPVCGPEDARDPVPAVSRVEPTLLSEALEAQCRAALDALFADRRSTGEWVGQITLLPVSEAEPIAVDLNSAAAVIGVALLLDGGRVAESHRRLRIPLTATEH